MATGKSNTAATLASIDRPEGTCFVGDVANVLEEGAAELRELSTLLGVILGLIDDGAEDSAGRAASLTTLAMRRLGDITEDVEATRRDCAREAAKLGTVQ